MAGYEDPGWRTAIRDVGHFLPIVHTWKGARASRENGLIELRRIFLLSTYPFFIFFIAFAFIVPWSSDRVGVAPMLVALLGAACLLGVAALKRRPMIVETPARLATAYRSVVFIGVGFAVLPALGSSTRCCSGKVYGSTSWDSCLR